MAKHQELRRLEQIERKAWNAKAHGSEVDICSIWGQEGKLYVAWCKAADDCRNYRELHGLLGMNWKQIANVE